MQKGWLFIFMFLLIAAASYPESTSMTADTGEPSGDSGCGVGDGCNIKCLNGDPDCSCETQMGNFCNEGYICRGRLLENLENTICCSIPCEKKLIIKPEFISGLLEDDILPEREYNELKLFLTGLLAALLVYFAIDMWESRNSLAYFVEREIEDAENMGKKIFRHKHKKPKKEPIKKIKTITPLIENVMEDLNKDERETIIKLIGKEGIKKEELRAVLGFNRDKMDYALIKLARRNIISLKGDRENPSIYFREWIK